MNEPSRLDLAKLSYAEVLDATKHQDDKTGRFLGAISFLIAGSLVFVDKDVFKVKYSMGTHELALPAISLYVFLVLIISSVVLFILVLSTPLTEPFKTRANRPDSHLFFLIISKYSEQEWNALWPGAGAGLPDQFEAEYIREAKNIANRVQRKYERSGEAAALLTLSLVVLALALFFSLDSIATGASSNSPLSWSLARRVLSGVILALSTLLLLYYRLREASIPRGTSGRFMTLHLPLLTFPVTSFLVVALAPTSTRELWAVAAIVALLGGSAIYGLQNQVDLTAIAGQQTSKNWSLERVLTLIIGLLVVAFAVGTVLARCADWQLLASVLLTAMSTPVVREFVKKPRGAV